MPDWLRATRRAGGRGRTRAVCAFARRSGTRADRRRRARCARGRIVHRLLQALPALPAERRAEAARRHLARAKEFDAAEREAIAREVLAVLGDARFAPLFAPGSRAEVPIVGIVSRG